MAPKWCATGQHTDHNTRAIAATPSACTKLQTTFPCNWNRKIHGSSKKKNPRNAGAQAPCIVCINETANPNPVSPPQDTPVSLRHLNRKPPPKPMTQSSQATGAPKQGVIHVWGARHRGITTVTARYSHQDAKTTTESSICVQRS